MISMIIDLCGCFDGAAVDTVSDSLVCVCVCVPIYASSRLFMLHHNRHPRQLPIEKLLFLLTGLFLICFRTKNLFLTLMAYRLIQSILHLSIELLCWNKLFPNGYACLVHCCGVFFGGEGVRNNSDYIHLCLTAAPALTAK